VGEQRRRLTEPDAATSVRMRAVRQRDTAPEVQVRALLHGAGVRFRACPVDLPGRPDIANKSRRWCVFVHGCFWHGHVGCKLARLPKTNRGWWRAKIGKNRLRDRRKEKAMRALGFRVAVVWSCELKGPDSLLAKLRRTVG
jgi:DNA mismatch endonuclease, patch repair protein